VNINFARTSLTLNGIAIANPFDSSLNLISAEDAVVELELEPLLRKKIVVRQLGVHGIETGTKRDQPARAVDTAGFAPRALREIHRFREQISVPLLSLTPIDTIRSILLDPAQLGTVRAAVALEQRLDSLRTTLVARADDLLRRDHLDSARALLARLKDHTPRSLGVAGVVRALADIRRASTRIDSLGRAADALQRDVRLAVDAVSASLGALDDARRSDYAFALSLLALPTIDAPAIGPALFGNLSISTFHKVTYLATLAREHAPPGLLPREKPGPRRMRRAGTDVSFVARESYPNFLLRNGEVSINLADNAGAAQGSYQLRVADISSEPALLGRPARFELNRSAQSSDVQGLRVAGSFDHSGTTLRDVISINATGIKLPAFSLPGVPLGVDLGRGNSELNFELNGEDITATWLITAPAPTWRSDSLRAGSLNRMEALAVQVIAGIGSLQVRATLSGTLAEPRLTVTSTLDSEIAASLRSVAGEQIARAEQRVRAQVDSLVDEKLVPVRARVVEVRTEVEQKLKESTATIDSIRTELAERLRNIGG
jgi:uncharacterized protein (TIGR03545 family)